MVTTMKYEYDKKNRVNSGLEMIITYKNAKEGILRDHSGGERNN